MAGKKNVLGKNPLEKKGRGLDAVISGGRPDKTSGKKEKNDTAEAASTNGEVILGINKIEPNKNQPRKDFDQEKLQELSDSIKEHGVVQPIVVTKQDGYYQIIAGERRWRAAKLAGLKEVPVVIKEYSPQEVMEVALIENIQREDLNPVEEAKAYQNLIDEYKLKQEDVAKKVSKNRTTITNALRLLKLDDQILDMLVSGDISSGHARALLAIDNKDRQIEIANKIAKDGLSVREVEKLSKEGSTKPAKKKENKSNKHDAVYEEWEEKLTRAMGTKVKIDRKNEKQGTIKIDYYSVEDFENIAKKLQK
ncbi:MAG: ParB/RepB/Spo0J family partition protein [Eubacterium sp.]|nr:ParB/RepB/Spo0J family partition protein [Eubacterium sp.]